MERFDFDTVINRKTRPALNTISPENTASPKIHSPFGSPTWILKWRTASPMLFVTAWSMVFTGTPTQAFLISGRSPAGRKTFQLGYPPGMAHKDSRRRSRHQHRRKGSDKRK